LNPARVFDRHVTRPRANEALLQTAHVLETACLLTRRRDLSRMLANTPLQPTNAPAIIKAF
jgi:hypothetical protein